MQWKIFVLVVFIMGCNPKESIDSLHDGKAVVEKFIKGFQSSEYSSLDSLYADQFWQSISNCLLYTSPSPRDRG